MENLGFLFPGQGAQKQGMGKSFYDGFEVAREVFDEAENVLTDCSIKSLCFEADEEELRRTENTQPSLFTVSYAIYRVLSEKGYNGTVFAGHSLGEYTAVTAAGYISFKEGLRTVRKRGLLMRDCDPDQEGGMAAVIGLDEETIERICTETGEVSPANFNSPGQIVISGKKNKITEACEKLEAAGAKKTVVLNVGGPFHSPYMKQAADELKKELESVDWKEGKGSIVSNVNAMMTDDPDKIKKNLVDQLFNPVLWSLSCQKLDDLGYQNFLEPGPSGILKGLFRRISKEVKVFSVDEPEGIDKIDFAN
jgi:[acyl-carrier-protein] S-malonyltransferase